WELRQRSVPEWRGFVSRLPGNDNKWGGIDLNTALAQIPLASTCPHDASPTHVAAILFDDAPHFSPGTESGCTRILASPSPGTGPRHASYCSVPHSNRS